MRTTLHVRLSAPEAALAAGLLIVAAVLCLSASGKDGSLSSLKVATPVVFTSRHGTAGFTAALPAPSERWPGTKVQRSMPGRLMLLTANGKLRDLTGGKTLPDGRKLLDVAAPSVSLDGKRVIFAGLSEPAGHYRLYETGIDGRGLRQLTGLPSDPGCSEPPFLLYGPRGEKLTPARRSQIDYDDLDPAYLPDGRIVFASTRLPRVASAGASGAHRVTNLWVMDAGGGDKHQITYNLAGERWPYVTKDGRVIYSYWSLTGVRASAQSLLVGESDGRAGNVITGEAPNNWWPASVNPDGTDLRALTKPPHSAVRARPLFNGNLVYTTQKDASFAGAPAQTSISQVPTGFTGLASGGRIGAFADFPRSGEAPVAGPGALASGAPWAVSPTALPPHAVVFSRQTNPADRRRSADYGLWAASDDWAGAIKKLSAGSSAGADAPPWTRSTCSRFDALIGLRKLVDLPGTCEGEAQAVYSRRCLPRPDQTKPDRERLTLASGRVYDGPVGGISSPDVYANPVAASPGQKTDSGEGPVYSPPPAGLIKAIEIYAVNMQRDKFHLAQADFSLELIGKAELTAGGGFHIKVPAGIPLMQVGRGADGRLATWTTAARDRDGRQAHLAAFAGDHFGYASEGVPASFCVGCHAGHTVLPGSSIADILEGAPR